MPTYEYKCDKCNHKFEEFQSMSSEPYAKCPVCGKKSKRVFSAGAGIIFKGSGFYVNDYKKKNSCSDTKGESCKNCSSATN